MTNSLPRELALRIALAAKALPDTDAKRMLRVIDAAVGLPLTAIKLQALTVKKLRSAANAEFADVDSNVLGQAVALLRGESEQASEPLPAVAAYTDGDMPNSIRVACASNQGELLDGHFGSCSRFLIYQVSATEQRLIDIRDTHTSEPVEDKNAYRASLISDCQLLQVASIGGPAAAKVIRAGVHPIKLEAIGSARAAITDIQHAIGYHAPPWLAKAMGISAEGRICFELEGGDDAWDAADCPI
ncbi:MAG: dinitrogenase iron-molybdenum cofactor biosynthesis protein [Gammaproteobacteria bacterium]